MGNMISNYQAAWTNKLPETDFGCRKWDTGLAAKWLQAEGNNALLLREDPESMKEAMEHILLRLCQLGYAGETRRCKIMFVPQEEVGCGERHTTTTTFRGEYSSDSEVCETYKPGWYIGDKHVSATDTGASLWKSWVNGYGPFSDIGSSGFSEILVDGVEVHDSVFDLSSELWDGTERPAVVPTGEHTPQEKVEELFNKAFMGYSNRLPIAVDDHITAIVRVSKDRLKRAMEDFSDRYQRVLFIDGERGNDRVDDYRLCKYADGDEVYVPLRSTQVFYCRWETWSKGSISTTGWGISPISSDEVRRLTLFESEYGVTLKVPKCSLGYRTKAFIHNTGVLSYRGFFLKKKDAGVEGEEAYMATINGEPGGAIIVGYSNFKKLLEGRPDPIDDGRYPYDTTSMARVLTDAMSSDDAEAEAAKSAYEWLLKVIEEHNNYADEKFVL